MDFQIGQPGVSAFLQSLVRDLDRIVDMGDYHILSVNAELKQVKSLLLGFEDVLLDGERKRQHGNKGAERWMDQLKHSFYDIDDLLDEIRMEKELLRQEITGQPSNNKVRYNFQKGSDTSRDIKMRLVQVVGILGKHTEEADRLKLKRDAVENDAVWLKSQAEIRRKPGCFADEPRVYGREKDKDEVIRMLLEKEGKSKYDVVCVVGMGGLGKTTLAQLVFDDDKVKNTFAVRGWACVSDVFDVSNVIKNLIESAAENGEKGDYAANMPSDLSALQARLKKIVKDQKFLLVLDDVWTTKVWQELKGPLNYGEKGSKILVTTRVSNVAKNLGSKEPYQLGRLADAECRNIFNLNAFEGGADDDEYLIEIGEKIAKKCKGVPLVAKVIGGLLRGEDDQRKWKDVNDNDLWNLAFNNEDLHPGLRLSYFYLPPFLKRCFEYFALFPSDFIFDQGDLVRMWIAEGFIEVKEDNEPEEIGDEYYYDLKGRSLIQEDDKIHDMVHHLACIVSGTSFFRGLSGSRSSASSLQSVRHAYIGGNHEVLLYANKLRTLFYKYGSLEGSFSCERLRVLKVNKSISPPVSFGSDLKHLRYLQLVGDFKNSILLDSLCMLTNLQVLVIRISFDFENLPQDIGILSNLRYLQLSHTGIRSLPDSVCSLSNLRVLDISNNDYLASLPQDIGNLRSLRSVMIYLWTPVSISLPESLSNATNLCVLGLSPLIRLPARIGKLTQLEEMRYYEVGKEEGRGIVELKDMNKLKGDLYIQNMENIDRVEDALMANLKRKKYIKDLKFVWKEYDEALTGRDGELETRVLEALEPNAAIESLFMGNYIGYKLPSWMWTAPLHNLTCLRLYNILAVTEMVGMEFKSLQYLHLTKCFALRKVSGIEFKSLLFLYLINCPALREVSMTTPKLKHTLES